MLWRQAKRKEGSNPDVWCIIADKTKVLSCLGYRRRITAHYPQISLFAGLAYGCVVMRLYVCVYTIICSSAMCSYDYILISYISNVVVSSHAHSSHMSFEFKPIEFDGFRTSHVYSSQRGWGLLWDFGWVFFLIIYIHYFPICYYPLTMYFVLAIQYGLQKMI